MMSSSGTFRHLYKDIALGAQQASVRIARDRDSAAAQSVTSPETQEGTADRVINSAAAIS